MTRRADELIASLELQPHPEGGHYRELYRSPQTVRRADDERSAVTTIFYLLRDGECSRWHDVASDEVWHFYDGEPLELVTYDPDTQAVRSTTLGPPDATSTPVHVVPAGFWQAARPRGGYCLAGCTVAPGFDFADFRFIRDVDGHAPAFADALAAYRGLL